MLSNFVAVEMTSHQNSPLYFDSIPAWRCVQIPEHPYKENNPEQRREMAEYHVETIQEEKHLRKKSSGALSR